MKPITQMILTLLVAFAVLAYTIYNYAIGKFGPFYLIMAVVLFIYLAVSLIRGLKKK